MFVVGPLRYYDDRVNQDDDMVRLVIYPVCVALARLWIFSVYPALA
jgi:hypothetical protein